MRFDALDERAQPGVEHGLALRSVTGLAQSAALSGGGHRDRVAHPFHAEVVTAGDHEHRQVPLADRIKHFMQGAIRRFRGAFPRVRIQFRGAMSSAECIEMLFREPVDLAFVTLGAELDGVREHPLLELDYVFLTQRSHALAKRSSLRVEDLAGLECIGLAEGRTSRSQLSSSLLRHGVTLETTMTVYDWDTAINLVELGVGSAIVPSWHAHAVSKRAAVQAIPISGLAPIRVGWALRDSHELLAPGKEFMRLLKQDFRERSLPPAPA